MVCCYVHRLVAQAFIPNPHGKAQVNHLNGDTLDNRAANLDWATQSENMIHAHANVPRRPRSTRPVEVGGVIYPSAKAAAISLGVSESHVRRVLLGQKKTVKGMEAFYLG